MLEVEKKAKTPKSQTCGGLTVYKPYKNKSHANVPLKTLSLPNTRGQGAGCGPSRGAARPRGGGDRRGAALRADRQRPPLLVVQAAGRAASGKIEGTQRQLGGPLGG
jgi:hypothetical protein